MAVQITRDPYSSTTLLRELIPVEDRRECPECTRTGRFRYYWQADGLRGNSDCHKGRGFCCRACWESHHH